MSQKSGLFKLFSDDSLRTINQTGVRYRFDLCDVHYKSTWDVNLSPDGILYYATSNESGQGMNTRLISYDYQTDTAKICFKAEHFTLHKMRQMPSTKLHESITFLPDGRVFGTTHTTDRAPQHPEWMPIAHHNHIWEGYPGSYMLVYDPKTGKTENWGMPVPRETIYGATYDKKHNAIYMIGFLKGHVYRYSIDDKTVMDLGKAAEIFCYRLHVGPDENIYGITKSGYLWRINVDTCKLEDLNWRVPEYPNNYVNNTWYRYLAQAKNVDDRYIIMTMPYANQFFIYDCKLNKMMPLGNRAATMEFYEDVHTDLGHNEFAIDKYGVLWYTNHPAIYYDTPLKLEKKFQIPTYLMRWDYKNGGQPEVLGVVGTEDRALQHCSGICIDQERDILYLVSNTHGVPESGSDTKSGANMLSGISVLCIDLEQYRPHMYTPGPVSKCENFKPRDITPEERAAIIAKGKSTEEYTASNPFVAFPIENVKTVRLWRYVPTDRIEDSAVVGLVWDDNNVLHGICGKKDKYCFQIKDGEVISFIPLQMMGEKYISWLEDSIWPRKFVLDESIVLPEVAGRRYLARATALTQFSGGRKIVGTADGLIAIIRDNDVYALGNAASNGPVRCLTTNTSMTRMWGVAGDDEDLGIVFYYDDKVGLRQLGYLIYNIHGYLDGPSASNVLSSIAVNRDTTNIAVGGADRIGTIHIATI